MEASKEESSDSLTNMFEKEIRENQLKSLEDQVAILKQAVSRVYENGWNEAMEKAAFDMETKFVSAFGKDTLSSIAIYLRSLKK